MVKKLDKEVRAKVVTLLTVYRSNLDILSHLEKTKYALAYGALNVFASWKR